MNTKLSTHQKIVRKSLLNANKASTGFGLVHDFRTTVVFVESGDFVEFTASTMGKSETKFKRKVGQYYALERFAPGLTVKLPKNVFNDFIDYGDFHTFDEYKEYR